MTPARSDIPPALGDVFRVGHARALGVTHARLRARDLDSPFWGVRTGAERADAETTDAEARRRVLDYVPRMVPGSFFTHISAAVLWRIPVPVAPDEPVHIGVHAPHRQPRGSGVRGHKLLPELALLRDLDGVSVACPASTWAQLASMLSMRDLVAVGDAIVRVPRLHGGLPGDPASALGTIEQLQAAIDAGRRVGIDKLREALPLIRPGASSRPETHLRLDLDDGVLPAPALDFEVRDDAGRLLGITEIAYPEFRVAVEYEGDHHRTSKDQWNRDIEKQRAYAAAGWAMVRLTSEHLYGGGIPARTLVRAALRRAGWRPNAG